MSNKKKVESLNIDVPLTEQNITISLEETPTKLSADISEKNEDLVTGMSTLMSGVTDVLVNGESVVENSIAHVNVTTTEYVDEKIAEVHEEMSILHQETQQQLSILNTKIDTGLSTLNNKINEVDMRLSDTKLDKNLSILPDANPNILSIESRDNLLVYLYNSGDDGTALKAKLTELGFWDELRDVNTAK